MTVADANKILREYLVNQAAVVALVGQRIYCPRCPENAELPAISYFTRGGLASPYIPDQPAPSMQIDCWASDPIDARELYRTLYSSLQGIQNQAVTVDGSTHYIISAIEEVQGQDLVDTEIQDYFRVLSFWQVIIR